MNDARGRVENTANRGQNPRPDRDVQRPTVQRPAAPRRPKWPIPLALLGLLGLALAAILASTANSRRQLPTDLNTVRDYSGTANYLFNQQALQQGNYGSALASNVPINGQRTIRVLDTDGDNARVLDERTLMSNGSQLGTSSNTYAVNRRSLEPASGAPAGWDAQPAQGLTVGFPQGAGQQDYSGWVGDTQSTVPLRFVREEARGGVNTYVYQADVAATPIRDQSVLGSLPTSLSRAQLQGIAPSLPLSGDQRTALTQALPGLPDQVPMNYTYQGTTTYWVEPTTGQIIDTASSTIRNGAIAGPGGATLANLPVYNVDTRYTDDAVAAAGREAADRRSSFNTGGRVWPWVLGTLGALALLAGLLGLLMRRRPEPVPATPQPTYRPQEHTYRAGPTTPSTPTTTTTTRSTADESDAARKLRESQRGQPQAPYSGQTPHAGPYRESTSGQPPAHEEEPTRRRPGER